MGLNLDIVRPVELASVLRSAGAAYRESHSELRSAWQDAGAGRIWGVLARSLEHAANRAAREGLRAPHSQREPIGDDSLNLDVDSASRLPSVLRSAGAAYRKSAETAVTTLAADCWLALADTLEKSADDVADKLEREGF